MVTDEPRFTVALNPEKSLVMVTGDPFIYPAIPVVEPVVPSHAKANPFHASAKREESVSNLMRSTAPLSNN
jgi:hypothetical protein